MNNEDVFLENEIDNMLNNLENKKNNERDIKNKGKENDKKEIKNNKKNLLIFFCLLGFSIIILVISFFVKNGNFNVISKYQINNNISYFVNYNEHSFYEDKKVGMNQTYITSITKNIDILFKEKTNLSKNDKISYSYVVEAIIVLTDSNDENVEVFNKTYTLAKNSKTINGSKIELNVPVVVDFKTYNEMLNQYKFKISMPVRARLIVRYVNRIITEKGIKEQNVQTLYMPLQEDSYNIVTDYKKNISGNLVDRDLNNKIFFIMLCISILTFSVSLFFGFRLLKIYIQESKKNYKKFKLNKIMNLYDNIIVEVYNSPDEQGLTQINVKFFKDMIDTNQELHSPILLYKTNYNVIFFIINEKNIYKYILNDQKEKI